MIITLTAASDDNANDFQNFFRSPVVIEPNSEIALVNAAYKFSNSIVLTGNLTFALQLGTGVSTTATVNAGTYTRDSFLTELNRALRAAITDLGSIANEGYHQERAFNPSRSEFVYQSTTSDELSLVLRYHPQDWATELADTATGVQPRAAIVVSDADVKLDEGSFGKREATNSYNRTWRAGGSGSGELGVLWGTAKDTSAAIPHGSFKFRIQQSNKEVVAGLFETSVPSAAADFETTMRCQIKLGTGSTFQIREWNGTALQDILPSALSYARDDLFEFRVDQLDPSGSKNINVRYFQNGTEITNKTAQYVLRPELKLIPAAAYKSPYVQSELINPATGVGLAGCIKTDAISITPGSGYVVGQVVSIVQGSDTTLLEITSVDASGGITGVRGVSQGGGLVASTAYSVNSASGAGSGATITPTVVAASMAFSNAGTGYSTGVQNLTIGATVVGTINITAVGGSGDITTASIASVNELSTDVAVGTTVAIAGGSSGALTVNAINSEPSTMIQLSYDTVFSDLVDEPLVEHSDASFTPSADFQTKTGLAFDSGSAEPALQIDSKQSVLDDRESDLMLVNVDQFQCKSALGRSFRLAKNDLGGGMDKAVASIPMGQEFPSFENGEPQKVDGVFVYRAYNLIYQPLDNPGETHNTLSVRMTDPLGNKLQQLEEVTLTFDLRPRTK